ncbi:MAG: hypothetical protein UX09_C0015G0030 [Candidatus Uhrbacteria bacterium GW2011_GWE2_45_35]|uniref:Methyltransferase domain-containing protein n=2 Tax=Candidatus Uhriibacteriota TaxID=1752732 RepID=A0A0G1JJ73_9BACT|nr:MAG: hypothetical protein UW63_C0017G0010 [Candidatus Uhrbacteria bacterium GW2011_GWF2_44_350]KKU08643.1 MAG: hypothetical protein UX09_C0015G0030 [Candidatus Uhrbacteria bacterium GW2011_GWE2_45_35]HBR80293.1 hypothetical protein [Candidatus Uhrbacteria bacterium]HCU31595.1 hypothetical protein [Candidatus Uhrbacteria bacterium]
MNLTQQTYNKIAEDWHRDHSSDDWWVEGTGRLISMLPVRGTVLDVGCGSGVKSKYLTNNGLKVVGIDFSENLIAIARRENLTSEFLIMDMRDVAELNREFDCVFAQASLLHIPRAEVVDVIKKLLKVLKIGGYFYAAVKGVKEDRQEEGIKIEDDYGYEYQRFFSYFRPEEIHQHFVEAGLEVVWENSMKTGNREWIQIIGRKVS